MASGQVRAVTAGDVTDLYYVDTGMYDTDGYTSVYLLDAERPALVDTGLGTDYELVRDAMEEVGIAPEGLEVIAPTHVHLDHAGGTGFLAEDCPNADVVCHERGARHLVDPTRLWEGTKQAVGEQLQFYTEPKPVPEDRVREVTDGDVVDLGDHELRVHHAPGHAPHHCIFEDPANDAVCTADAAGIYVPSLERTEPTTPPPNFDYEQCMDDVDAIADIDPSVLLYSHFGPVEGTETLAEYRDVLTGWVDTVEAARDDLGEEEAIERLVREKLHEGGLVEAWGELKVREETRMNVRGVLRYLGERD